MGGLRGNSRYKDNILGHQKVWLEPGEEGREYLELKLERGVRGREIIQGIWGWVKDFRLYPKTPGEILKDFKLEGDQVYLLKRPLLVQWGE